MKAPRLVLACTLFTFVAALTAIAGPRTFVSGLGNDANPGTREQPKRTFASALTVTDTGGEIIALDSAGYASSTLTIDKAISIIAPPGVYAGVKVPAFATGIFVNATAAGMVTLRGLTITGGAVGIEFYSAKAFYLENCTIKGVAGDGFFSGGAGSVFMKDTSITGCTERGIYIATPSIRLSADNVRLEKNKTGMDINTGSDAWISHSVISGNTNWGVRATASSSGTVTEVALEECAITGNGTGLQPDNGTGTAIIRASNLTVSGNTNLGLASCCGSLLSRGNNTVEGNGTNGSFSGSFAAK